MADSASLSPEEIRKREMVSNDRMRTARSMIDVALGMSCDAEDDMEAMQKQIALAERQMARARAILAGDAE